MPKLATPLLTSLLFAGSFIAGKYTTRDLGPLTTSFLRYLVALIFLGILAPRFGYSKLRTSPSDISRFLGLGITGIVGYHYFFFLALRHTEVAHTAIINALSPVVTGLMAALFIRERLTLRNYFGVGLAVMGVLLLLTKGQLSNLLSFDFALGDILMLCSVISWVAYALLVKSLSAHYHGFTITFYATLYGVCMLLLLATGENLYGQLSSISIPSIYAVLYMGIGASGLGYLFYNLSINNIGPTKTSGFVYSVVPVFVAVLSWAFFGEPITGVMGLSAVMILGGLHVMLRNQNSSKGFSNSRG
ncbi:MAG: DMT family transporter [Chloroflexales bacterium]|nr:DMT family transporter [Chloroflexales bacterium]